MFKTPFACCGLLKVNFEVVNFCPNSYSSLVNNSFNSLKHRSFHLSWVLHCHDGQDVLELLVRASK